jgi:hypothetical protein
MDTKKFDYLETIREAIETGDYEELDEYVEDIRERVKADPDFAELFGEIKSRNYLDAISLIDEFIYADIESEIGTSFDDPSIGHMNAKTMMNRQGLIMEMQDDSPEEISFEEFNDEDYSGSGLEEEN